MNNKFKPEGILEITPKLFNDDRGFFYESYSKQIFDNLVNENINFVQDNHSFSKKYILRGFHYQKPPFEQGKLIRVIQGEVIDYVLDLRPNSNTFLKYFEFVISEKNKKQLWIPNGFAHAFLTLSDDVHFLYKTTNYYSKQHEININPFDEDLNISFPIPKTNIVMSAKDRDGIKIKEINNFIN